MLKVMTIFGTRPEAIKMAPLVKALEAAPDMEPIVTVTAQHRDMLDQVLRLFDITPDYDLNIMSQGQTLYDVTNRALMGLKSVLEEAKPDVVLVHGDTTTTFAGALASFYQEIPVGHVEAGLRTGDIYSPFPEEMNRKLTGSLATYHFAPTASSEANLKRENINTDHLYVTGNTVIDALDTTVKDNYVFDDAAINALDPNKRTVLVTTHRRENLGEPMRHVYQAIRVVLRDTTERPEAVDAGTVRLVGTDKDAVYKAAYELLHDAAAYKTMSNSVNPYGDGKASERILQALRHEFLGDANRPERFGK